MEQPPVPSGVREPLAPWIEQAEAESGDLDELLRELPAILMLLLTVSIFFAVVIALVLTLVQLAKFPWLAGG